MAVLHHKGDRFGSDNFKGSALKIDKTITEFLDDTLTEYNSDYICQYNGNPVYYNNKLPIKDGQAFCVGVTIGEIRKNRILPHHQFFTALGNRFKRQINLSAEDPRLAKYLHGEEIDVDCENGWAVVLVDGISLGGAKVVNGRAKNHYPKGLRK